MTRRPLLAAVLAAFLAGTVSAANADCALEAQRKPAQWQRDPLPAVGQAPIRAMLSRLGSTVETILAEPRGYQPRWWGVLLDNHVQTNSFAEPYGVSAAFFHFYCRNDQILRGGETATWAYLNVNYLRDFARSADLNGKSYMWIKARTATRDGYPYLEYPESAWMNHIWLITRNGRLPYTPLTRKEYLAEARAEVDEHIRGTRGETTYYKQAISAMDREERISPADLAKPAIVSELPVNFRGFSDGHPDAEMPVRWDPAYFERSKYEPQFIVVRLRAERSDPKMVELIRQLMTNIDFHALERYLEPAGLGRLVASEPVPSLPPTRRRAKQRDL
jgi:hypothetical protein